MSSWDTDPKPFLIVDGKLIHRSTGLTVNIPLREHLAGKHDQRTHGRHGGAGSPTGLQAAEREIMGKDTEHMVILSPAGEVLARASGDKDNIYLSVEERRAITGNVITHNHPPIDYFGGNAAGLSASDVLTATRGEAAEIRAVAKDGTVFSLKPGKSGWGDVAEVHHRLTQNAEAVSQRYNNMLRDGSIKLHDAAAKAQYEVIGLTAANMGWTYEVSHVDMV